MLATPAFANEIDGLKTFADVTQFLKTKVLPKTFESVILDPAKANTSTRFGKHSFHKLDLDGNGLTDLVVDGYYFLAVIDQGKGKYDLQSLDRGSFSLFKYTLSDIEWVGKTPVLLIKGYKGEDDDIALTPAEDKKIVYKFGAFTEYNPEPDRFAIRKISFSTGPCFGSCPVYSLDISADRRARFNAKQYNDKKGVFTGTIDPETFNTLVDTINYLGILRLKSEYAVPWTDDQGATLSITFDTGRTVKIRDYGMIGTFGLENLYDQFSELRKTVKWNA